MNMKFKSSKNQNLAIFLIQHFLYIKAVASDYFNLKLWRKLEIGKNQTIKQYKIDEFLVSKFILIDAKIKFEIEQIKRDLKIKN